MNQSEIQQHVKRQERLTHYQIKINDVQEKLLKLREKKFNKVVEKSIFKTEKQLLKYNVIANDISTKIEAANEKERLLIEKRKYEKKINRINFLNVLSEFNHTIDQIKTLLTEEDCSVDDVCNTKIFSTRRHDLFDNCESAEFLHKEMPRFGDVDEHINGRSTVVIYCLWAILNNEIETVDDLIEFSQKYCGFIKTDQYFNINIVKPLQNGKGEFGAITSKEYIAALENYFNIKLSEEQKEYFSSKFLYDYYGTVTKKQVVEFIKNNI